MDRTEVEAVAQELGGRFVDRITGDPVDADSVHAALEAVRRSPQGEDHEGLYRKYEVRRVDGQSVDGQEFFVLRVDPASEDSHAIAALEAYARSCWRDKPDLAQDLGRVVRMWRTD